MTDVDMDLIFTGPGEPHCPKWCRSAPHTDQNHGLMENGTVIHEGMCAEAFLHSLCNGPSGKVLRSAGFMRWMVDALRIDDLLANHAGHVQVRLTIDGFESDEQAELPLTPGEARSLAAALIRVSDDVEGLS